MEFLKSDGFYLKSCWITWTHPGTKMKVTLYPMVHIGDRTFYDRVSDELERCQYVLYEGVTWRSGSKKHPLYDLVASNLRISAQETSLRIPPTALKINLDMGRSEFRTLVLRLPLKYLAKLIFLRRILWLLTLPPALRIRIRKVLLRPRKNVQTDDSSALSEVIVKARDKRIVENLQQFHREIVHVGSGTFVAIIFGAAHMPAISVALRELGFRAGTRRWVEVLRRESIVKLSPNPPLNLTGAKNAPAG